MLDAYRFQLSYTINRGEKNTILKIHAYGGPMGHNHTRPFAEKKNGCVPTHL